MPKIVNAELATPAATSFPRGAYDSAMRRRREDEDASPNLLCERCQETFERALVQECSYCSKDFCRNCAVRSGNTEFCSKSCAQAFFFADDGDAAEEEE